MVKGFLTNSSAEISFREHYVFQRKFVTLEIIASFAP